MRLGGPVHDDYDSPEEWVAALRDRGYSAAYCPVEPDADPETVAAYADAAREADIEIAEVGAWGENLLAHDEGERRAALSACKRRLELAEAVGARCCVSLAGSRGRRWMAPHPDNFAADSVDQVVAAVQAIVDDVDPDGASYTLEPMPWTVPDSAASYRRLLDAVDRERFGVHFDPVNMIASPRRYADNTAFVEGFVDELGPEIRCVHLKDVSFSDELTVHIEETRPGTGDLDYRALLTALDELGDEDLPLMLEHLDGPAEYAAAADYVRSVADEVGVAV